MRWIKFFWIIFIGVRGNPDPPERGHCLCGRARRNAWYRIVSCCVPLTIFNNISFIPWEQYNAPSFDWILKVLPWPLPIPGFRGSFQNLLSSLGNMETYVWHNNPRGVFFGSRSTRTQGDTEKRRANPRHLKMWLYCIPPREDECGD